MVRFAVLLGALAWAAFPLPALAQRAPAAPSPHASVHHLVHPHAAPAAHPSPKPSSAMLQKVPTTFSNPGAAKVSPGIMTGQDCNGGANANAAQRAVNPINGSAQAKTFVSIPLGKGQGSVASSTSHAQQIQTCAHTH